MPKEEHISAAKAADRLDITWLQVTKALSYMSPDMKPTKPDTAKLGPMMEKAKKPAEFFLTFDGKKLTLEVRVASTRIVLGTQDVGAQKDPVKQRAVLQQLADHTSLVTQADLAAFDKAHPPPPDPKVQERIAYLKNAIENLKIMRGAANYKHTKFEEMGPNMQKELGEWATGRSFERWVTFVADLDSGKSAGTVVDTYLANGARLFVKLRDSTSTAIQAQLAKGEKVNFTEARKEIVQMINTVALPKFNSEKLAKINEEITKMETELKGLTRNQK